MSSNATTEMQQSSLPVSKSQKHKKKKTARKDRPNGKSGEGNGTSADEPEKQVHDDNHEQEDEPDTPLSSMESRSEIPEPALADAPFTNGGMALNGTSNAPSKRTTHLASGEAVDAEFSPHRQSDTSTPAEQELIVSDELQGDASAVPEDTEARFEALNQEREALRDEVAQLRKSLEELRGKHEEELIEAKARLQDTQGEKDHAEMQYRNLLGKVNTIKSQLGERLKADAEELSQARGRIEELEEQCGVLQGQNDARTTELAAMAEEGEQRSKELSSLRNRTTLSQQNWSKERDDFIRREAYAREEFEAAKQAMQDWEVLAIEERSLRESLAERVADLEDQVSNHQEAYDKAASERDSQSLTVDGLQRALQEIQDARRQELRELVENSQSQVEGLQKQLKEFEGRASEATNMLEIAKQELERALPFEKEVKEKNLLIGKLRHEAVILNDHLTKALRYLKKGKPEDNIDK
ncbi:septinsspn2 [Physcia stellaris]|nr:septinsspn2 [Physcia stellaris]